MSKTTTQQRRKNIIDWANSLGFICVYTSLAKQYSFKAVGLDSVKVVRGPDRAELFLEAAEYTAQALNTDRHFIIGKIVDLPTGGGAARAYVIQRTFEREGRAFAGVRMLDTTAEFEVPIASINEILYATRRTNQA